MGLFSKLFGRRPEHTRDPRFAGLMYPEDRAQLRAKLGQQLEQAQSEAPTHTLSRARALLVPYGDMDYAGPVAARGYAALGDSSFSRALILGPSLRTPFRGMALSAQEAFATPLGFLLLDREAIFALRDEDRARYIDVAHNPEPSLELQLPWLQMRDDDGLRVMPILVGDARAEAIADHLEELVRDPDLLLIVSANLSQDMAQEQAMELGRESLAAIEAREPGELTPMHTDCRAAIGALLLLAERMGWSSELLDHRSSHQIAGVAAERVASYAAVIFGDREDPQPEG